MSEAVAPILRKVPLFSVLDDRLVLALAMRTRRRAYPPGQVLFFRGDPGQSLFVIVSGRVKIQTTTASGETVHLATRGPGEHFGELSLIDGQQRMADAVTDGKTELLILERQDFLKQIEESSEFALAIMANLADRLRQAADHFEAHQELDVLGRTAQVLLRAAEEYGKPDPRRGTRIDAKMTHQQIAEQIGATRESVSRAIAHMKTMGAIRTDGRTLVVMSEDKLKSLTET